MVKQHTLSIVLTSDIHGQIVPVHYGTKSETSDGLSRVSTYVEKLRKRTSVLLIDNGDNIQGTPLTYHYVKEMRHSPNPVIMAMNYMEYDIAVIGNHEFNYGMEVLHNAVKESTFPWLCANIINKKTGLPIFGNPYVVKKINGISVAILGVTTHYIPNWENPKHIENLVFEDVKETTEHWVKKIRQEEKPDLLVVSYHGGFERDLSTGEQTENLSSENQGFEICKDIQGIDILLTGHQHRQIHQFVHGVAVVQPGFKGEVVGQVDVIFEEHQGNRIVKDIAPKLVSMREVKSDLALEQLVHEYESKTQSWLDQPIGYIDGNMLIQDPFEARLKEHPLTELINKVQMEVAGVEISNSAIFNNEATGLPSKVTMRDIVANYVYPNTLAVIEITGKDMKDALERSASYFTIGPEGQITVNPTFCDPKPQHYNYDMWEGIEYTINVSNPEGNRIENLIYKGKLVQKEDSFDVVMNNYRAGGGGDYPMFKGKPIKREIQTDMSEILATYFKRNPLIKAQTNDNWRVIK
ncbi:bifunctional metallophosphatase/5'-nucleotidase [Mangrovibacillus cuniculi]|uniref:Bifunctional metallophosphatase/5'-nucleotidase n=1 Tax=Mangrovibacillus cuniculi TaxID=2593652 RepID=A0A7S8HER5_9BACI|nr:bifunctional UDP-sugar hydrolase/5'-nucleotidase [Mangrovibacillus cuniculi]QPC46144.1 bifunctional metallophosphatase/5'-nucleotidase [Mangrovibacillus cuniculi]